MRKIRDKAPVEDAAEILRRLERWAAMEILASPDERVLEEAREDGIDPPAAAAALRERALEALRSAKARRDSRGQFSPSEGA